MESPVFPGAHWIKGAARGSPKHGVPGRRSEKKSRSWGPMVVPFAAHVVLIRPETRASSDRPRAFLVLQRVGSANNGKDSNMIDIFRSIETMVLAIPRRSPFNETIPNAHYQQRPKWKNRRRTLFVSFMTLEAPCRRDLPCFIPVGPRTCKLQFKRAQETHHLPPANHRCPQTSSSG